MSKKGFVTIMVFAALAIIVLVAVVIVTLGSGEVIQTRASNSTEMAYYMAISGAEDMYARLRSISDTSGTILWPQTIGTTNVQINGATLGSYSASANVTQTDIFMITSTGTVNGRSSSVTSKYGFTSSYTNGLPVGSDGPMVFLGHKPRNKVFGVSADGPVEASGTITPDSTTNNVYVTYNGSVTENSTSITPMSFWSSSTAQSNLDVNSDGLFLTDTNGDSQVTIADAQNAAEQTIFNADDAAGDGVIGDKDAFVYYYTQYYDQAANNPTGSNLGISGPGDTYYYSGNSAFGPGGFFNDTIPDSAKIVFIDGDVDIVFNAQGWWNGHKDLTIVATGDITIAQPWNGSDDRLTLVAYGDILTGGLNIGNAANVDGNFNMFACGNIDAVLGGVSNGSIMANGSVNVDTEYLLFGFLPVRSSRDFNQGTDNWADPANRPLGIPPNFPIITKNFVIDQELGGHSSGYPFWQRR